MTLNEAIREGCRVFPKQAFGSYNDGRDGRCALGAAGEAVGLKASFMGRFMGQCLPGITTVFPELKKETTCPHCNQLKWVIRAIQHLNDHSKWSREAIAEWADPRPDLHVAMPQVSTPESLPTHA